MDVAKRLADLDETNRRSSGSPPSTATCRPTSRPFSSSPLPTSSPRSRGRSCRARRPPSRRRRAPQARRQRASGRLRRVLTNSHLFGEAAEQAAPVVADVVDAPETTLSLTLKGILSQERTTGRAASAIISSNRGEEQTYHVGRSIDNADGATLHSVYADRVLLNRNGRLETLRLPKELARVGCADGHAVTAAASGATAAARCAKSSARTPRGSRISCGSRRTCRKARSSAFA